MKSRNFVPHPIAPTRGESVDREASHIGRILRARAEKAVMCMPLDLALCLRTEKACADRWRAKAVRIHA